MTERLAAASPRSLARIAGVLYLINIIGGLFTIGYITAAMIVPGDAAATAHNIQTHELLYRLGIVVHIIVLLTNFPLAAIFYDVFKVVNRRLALLVLCFLLVGTAIEGAYLLNQFAPLILLEGGQPVSGLTAEQLQAQVSTPLDLSAIGYSLGQVFYVGYLLLTGYLIFRSTFLPPHSGSAAGVRRGVLPGLQFRGLSCTGVCGPSGPIHPAALRRWGTIALLVASYHRCERRALEGAGQQNLGTQSWYARQHDGFSYHLI